MKKTISLLITMMLILSSISLFSGCYIVEKGTKKDIAGTYKLEKYEYKEEDILTKKQITNYLVVGEDGKGYKYYKDNTMQEPDLQEIRINFKKAVEEDDLYDHIEYKLYEKNNYNFDDIESLGFNKGNNTLTRASVKIDTDIIKTDSYNITYKKISDDETLKKVNEETKNTLSAIPFEMAEYTSLFLMNFHYVDIETRECINTEFQYFIINFDVRNSKLDITYALKNDEIKVEEKNINYITERDKDNKLHIIFKGYNFVKDDFGFLTTKVVKDNKNYELTFHREEGKTIQDIIK